MKSFLFKTTDHVNLFVREFRADAALSCVIFVAGVESHGGWYEESLNLLKNRGITSYFLDRRGSGRSEGLRGDIPDRKRLVEDLSEFGDFVKSRETGKPLCLAALSWGAKWALSYWKHTSQNIYNRLLLITPGIYRHVDLKISQKIKASLSHLCRRDELYTLPIPTPFFTQNRGKLDFLDHDPHRLHAVTARFLAVNFLMDREIRSLRGVYQQRLKLFLAGQDKIVKNEEATRFLKEHFYDVDIKIYPHASHTLEFEVGQPYFEDMSKMILN